MEIKPVAVAWSGDLSAISLRNWLQGVRGLLAVFDLKARLGPENAAHRDGRARRQATLEV